MKRSQVILTIWLDGEMRQVGAMLMDPTQTFTMSLPVYDQTRDSHPMLATARVEIRPEGRL